MDGSIFVFLTTNFCDFQQKEAQFLNLILFISTSISVFLFNLKEKNIDFELLKKVIPFLIIGSYLGTKILNFIDDSKLRIYFSVFLLLLGLYEIFSSLFLNKLTNNNTRINRKENKNV